MMALRVRVITDYHASYPEPLRIKTGDLLQVVRSDDEYPGWIWCTANGGKAGWLPESWADIQHGVCTMIRDYDGTELAAVEGDILTVDLEESGWLWCVNSAGQRGWIPKAQTETL
jgi:hypothetical protein